MSQLSQRKRKVFKPVTKLAPVKRFKQYMPPKLSLIEKNYLDVNTTVSANSTGSITLLNGVSQGTGATQRIGLRMNVDSIQWSLYLTALSAATTQYVRMFLVWDKNPNGATPTVSAVIDIAGGQYINLVNRDRFQILKMYETVLLGNNSSLITEATAKSFTGYKKLNVQTLHNSGTTGVIGDIQQGALWLICYGTAAAGTSAANVEVRSRLRFQG